MKTIRNHFPDISSKNIQSSEVSLPGESILRIIHETQRIVLIHSNIQVDISYNSHDKIDFQEEEKNYNVFRELLERILKKQQAITNNLIEEQARLHYQMEFGTKRGNSPISKIKDTLLGYIDNPLSYLYSIIGIKRKNNSQIMREEFGHEYLKIVTLEKVYRLINKQYDMYIMNSYQDTYINTLLKEMDTVIYLLKQMYQSSVTGIKIDAEISKNLNLIK